MAKYPETPVPSYSVIVSSKFNTLINTADTGDEIRRMLVRFPRRSVELPYPPILEDDRDTLYTWYRTYHGAYGDISGYLFYFFDVQMRKWIDEKIGYGTGSQQTFDLPSKSTVAGSVIIYVDGTSAPFTLLTGGGQESSDRVTITTAPGDGALITATFKGKIRLRARFEEDGWEETTEGSAFGALFNITTKLREVPE